jgi:OHCU decarboxylase
VDLAALNDLPVEAARSELAACCASQAWVEQMADRRPYPDVAALLAAAEEVWWDLTPDDWLEAFAAHPRIGEQPEGDDRTSRWSRREQSGVENDPGTADTLAECNRAYEERFGFTFLIFASDRSAAEILDACRARLANDEMREVSVAAAEQARITNLRLRRLLAGD